MNKKLIAVGLIIALSIGISATKTYDSKMFEVTKNIEIFTQLFKELNTYYVDDLDPGKLMRTGVDAMLHSLDPYTNYISENQIERYRYLTEGKYDGIGSQVELIDDYVTIVEPYKGFAADEAGLKAGDQIISIEGRSTKGLSSDEVNQMLRGVPGTEVKLGIKRYGQEEPFEVVLKRGEVNVPNVPYYNMVNDKVGYIALTTFTRDAGKNVRNALQKLKKENPGIEAVILDLRENGGGLLMEAVNVSNVFVDKGQEIATTKGKIKDWDRSYSTRGPAEDLDIPLAVLVNDRSASASEIVSGVIQDLDRGVIIGQRTYGKGLVQNTRDLGYNSRIKMTTAKYYIPSGRCIQSVEYEQGEPVDIADSLRAVFYTSNGRPVLDGGGITPDVKLEEGDEHPFIRSLQRNHIIFNYANEFVLEHDSILPAGQYEFVDYDRFVEFARDRGFEYSSASEKELEELKLDARKEGMYVELNDEIERISEALQQAKADDFEEFRKEAVDLIEQELATRYYYQEGKIKQRLKNDPEVDTAIAILLDKSRYNEILSKK